MGTEHIWLLLVTEQVARPHISTNNPKPRDTGELAFASFSFLKLLRSLLYLRGHKYPRLKSSLVPTFSQRTLEAQSSYSSHCLVLIFTEPEREIIPAHWPKAQAPKGKEHSQASAYSHSHSSKMSTCPAPKIDLFLCLILKSRDLLTEIAANNFLPLTI